MGSEPSAGGAVGAVLGGRSAGRALKWEFIVFLKENIGFSRSGELPGGPWQKGTFERAAPTSADPKGQVVALMRPVMPQ